MFQTGAAQLLKKAGKEVSRRLTVWLLAQLVLLGPLFHLSTSANNYSSESIERERSSSAQSKEGFTPLDFGKPVERELTGEQVHTFQISLDQGQWASVVVLQRGVDLQVQLLSGDGKPIADFDTDIRAEGEERIDWVAETNGSYRLVVKAKYPKLRGGRYEIRWLQARDATEKDRLLHETVKLQAESRRLLDAGKYSEALTLGEKALELRERVSPNDPDLHHTLLNLTAIHFRRGQYAKAEELAQRALRIAETALGDEHPHVARLLYTLALIYDTRGDELRVEPLLQRAASLQERTLGPEHPHLAHTLNRLAILFRKRGDFVPAESLFQRALVISEKVLGESHDDVAHAVNTLAALYREKGDYVKAGPLYERALSIYVKNRGPEHPFIAPPLHNLANLYRDMGDFDKAEPLYRRSIAIREKAFGPNHPDLAGSRASLALLYYLRGDYAQAKPLYLSALASLEKVLGPNHPLVAWHLTYLAKLFTSLGDHSQAESLSRRAFTIYETAYGPNCYYLAEILIDLAKRSAAQNQHSHAIALESRANRIIEHHVSLNLATGSERQKLAYLGRLPEQLNQVISLHVDTPGDDPAARNLAVTTVLQRKGRIQDALSQSLASLRTRSSSEDRALLDQLVSVSSRLARLVLNEPQGTSPVEHQKQVVSLEERREKLEGEISNRSAGFYEKRQPVTLAAVQAAIPEQAALVEFSVYRPFDAKASDDMAYGEPRYVVYVVRRKGEVRWKDLGDTKTIDSILNAFRRQLRDPHTRSIRGLSRALDERVMRPIRALVADASQLLLSPDGELNLIPFEALIDEQGRYGVERYSFTYLTSGRDLLRLQTLRESKSSPVVIADPIFGDPLVISRQTRIGIKRNDQTNIDYSKLFFGPLPGVSDEVRALKSFLPTATFLTRDQATEANLKLVNGPQILHIATHGFFLQNISPDKPAPAATKNSSVRNDNPLLRSGLALAGANQGGSGDDDGVLTALEATALNLWGTKLVVLSACDTGVGEVKNGEGVYGLRRALFLAGTESQLMSLWPVSDRSTRELMTGYYQALMQDVGRGEALRQVQLKMLRNKVRSHPYYWASFILAGEWANLKGQR